MLSYTIIFWWHIVINIQNFFHKLWGNYTSQIPPNVVALGFSSISAINTLTPRQNGHHCADNLLNAYYSIIWNNYGIVYWCKYALLGLSEVTHCHVGILLAFFSNTWLHLLHIKIWGYIGFAPSVHPLCCVCSVTPAVLGGFLSYWAQMITSMRECVTHNDLWPWPISSRSFSHDFEIKLIKFVTSCCVCSKHLQFWMDSFHICH